MSKTKNLRLVLYNEHDAATLTASSAASGTPIENTQINDRAEIFRSADLTELVIVGTLPAGAFVDSLNLLGHNLSAAGTVRLTLLEGENEPWDSGEQSTGEIIPAGIWRAGIDPWGATYNEQLRNPATMFRFPITPITGYRITINDPGNSDGAIEIGRIVLGQDWVPEFNASYDLPIANQDRAQHEYSAGQTLRTINGGNTRRTATIELNWLVDADRSRLVVELGQRGMIADVFVDLYPESTGIERLNGAFLARMTEGYGDSHYIPLHRKTKLSFIEV
ncbi:hypothetical protein [Vreelandella neptunia]|uniref:hypothetical protein n=1 Tax=Vreelandella neptunia TaxID=115551 RepID=UPI00315A73F2